MYFMKNSNLFAIALLLVLKTFDIPVPTHYLILFPFFAGAVYLANGGKIEQWPVIFL